MLTRKLYYLAKPLIPRPFQLSMRRVRIRMLQRRCGHTWPIYEPAAKGLASGMQWPGGKRFALLLTHDVESEIGRDRTRDLVQIETELGFRSAFYFVPQRYETDPALREDLAGQGFEIGVHGWNHDGKLYNTAALFHERVSKINGILSEWNTSGFSSPCAHHNLEWTSQLDIKYAVTTYDTDPFEPQAGGVGTIFPFCVRNCLTGRKYIEIPYTLPQDFALYILMRKRNIDIWKHKLDWIARNGGMAHLKTHPDYMTLETERGRPEEYPISYYTDLLRYIKTTYSGQYWHVCPDELAAFFYENMSSDPWIQRNGDTLCPTCRSAFMNNTIQIFGVA